jgi:23S rRNA pseudouridine2605 synthase
MKEKPPAAASPNPTREGQRIAKVMARAGLCSRRDAESWILEGRVSVNGKILESPAFNVTADDDIRVDGQRLKEAERTRLFLFHKPRGLVTTARDPEGRPTIFDSLPEDLPRVVAVGRLDINTEGLILLTNDGGLARVLELPATGWLRRYRVRAHGAIEQAQLDALADGVTIEGVHYAGIEARLEREQGSNVWIMMGLREGKNREIKRVLEHLGLSVNRLIRVSFGPFELGDLAEGEVAEVRTRVLRDQLGAKLAREAGVNFDADVVDHAAPPPPPPPAPRPGERRWAGGRERSDRDGPKPRGAIARKEPEPSQAPRKRKHVSALRAEIAAGGSGPRKRIERSATSDRKGREIKVERIVATPETLRRREAESARRERSRQRAAPEREARPSRSPRGEPASPERRGGKPFEKRASSGEGRPPSREGGKPFHKRAPSGEARSAPRSEGKPFEKRGSSGEGRPPSREGGKPFHKRAPSDEARSAPRSEGKPFEKRASSGEGRPPPREGGKPFHKRAPSGEARSAPRGEGKPFEKRGSSGEGRPPSREGGKPFHKRAPSGEARSAPRGEGNPFEKRASSGEGRPPPRGGGKPFGKRPSSGEGRSPPRGGKPDGKRPPRRP